MQLVLPGETACLECTARPRSSQGTNSGSARVSASGACAASLPTTTAILAGVLAQTALKHLLEFGTLSQYVSYEGLADSLTQDASLPDVECPQARCRELQEQQRCVPGRLSTNMSAEP